MVNPKDPARDHLYRWFELDPGNLALVSPSTDLHSSGAMDGDLDVPADVGCCAPAEEPELPDVPRRVRVGPTSAPCQQLARLVTSDCPNNRKNLSFSGQMQVMITVVEWCGVVRWESRCPGPGSPDAVANRHNSLAGEEKNFYGLST